LENVATGYILFIYIKDFNRVVIKSCVMQSSYPNVFKENFIQKRQKNTI